MFTLGAEILPYHDFPLDSSLRELANMGFTHVNLWSSRAPLAHHVNPGDDVAEIKRLLRTYGITPTALTMYGKTQDEMGERIEIAADLGIDTVVFDCEADYGDFVGSFLPPLLKTCERVGVRIAVENHLTVPFTADFEAGGHETERWSEGVDSLAQIKRLVTDIDSPYLGVCLAPPHLWVMNETISEVITFPGRAQEAALLLRVGYRPLVSTGAGRPQLRARRRPAAPARRDPRSRRPAANAGPGRL